MADEKVGTGGSTHPTYSIYDVPIQSGESKLTYEIHAYENENWKRINLFTRIVARLFGRVVDQEIDGKSYVVVNTLYHKGRSNKEGTHLSAGQIQKNIESVLVAITEKKKRSSNFA